MNILISTEVGIEIIKDKTTGEKSDKDSKSKTMTID